MLERVLAAILVVVVLSACDGDPSGEDTVELGPGADTPEEAISGLFDRLAEGEFAAAASLALPDQAALASLAEGASVADVAEALRDGDAVIAANFWSGFAQSVDDLLVQGVQVLGSSTASAEGVEFSIVEIGTAGGDIRHMTTREDDGHRVDIFATFGPALAGRLYPQVELLFDAPSDDAAMILSGLREQVPSLYIAADTPDLAPNVVQDILQLIELITRIN